MIIKEENVRKIKIKSCGIILFIILLRDNRLALSFSSGIITILDPNNDYKCDIQIKEYKEPIYSFCDVGSLLNLHIISFLLTYSPTP